MTYNVINMSPKMATNTTHLTDFLTSASMSCLDLSNKSVRHLLVYSAGAGSLPFSTPPVPSAMSYAGKTLDLIISVLRDIYLDRTFVFIHHCYAGLLLVSGSVDVLIEEEVSNPPRPHS
jgi:hypothetical protein